MRSPARASAQNDKCLGLALLGIAAVNVGAPRWVGAAIVVGALGEGASFATGTMTLVIIASALLVLACCKPCGPLSHPPGVS